jgi:hypothetical protein
MGLDRAGEVFDTATPPRPNARKVLVMYTDGESTSRDYNGLKDLVKHLREQDIQTFVVTVTNTSYQPGLQILASSFAHIYHMGQKPQMGQSSLSDAVCWAKKQLKQPSLTFVDTQHTQNIKLPGAKTKCEKERDAAVLVIQNKVPIMVPIFVPECTSSGQYTKVQKHPGTGYKWCVDTVTGEIVNGTKVGDGDAPPCSNDDDATTPPTSNNTTDNTTFWNTMEKLGDMGKNITNIITNLTKDQGEMITKYIPPIALSRCQEERDIAKEILEKKIPSSAPVHVPSCDKYGFYNAMQGDDSSLYMWCVDIMTGDILNGTRVFNDTPTCPQYEPMKRPLTLCEEEKEENLKKLTQIPDIHIPECSLFDGLYLDVQRTWVGSKFCVKRFSGDHVKGTDTEIGKPDPVCPDLSKCAKMQVQIHTHHYRNMSRPAILRKTIPQCKRDGFFEEVQSNQLINMFWCVNKITGMFINNTVTYDKKPECPGISNDAMTSYISGLVNSSEPAPTFLSSYYNKTEEYLNKGKEYLNKTKQALNTTISTTPVPMHGSRPLTHCEKQKADKEEHKMSVNILPCSHSDGLYIEIQQSVTTLRMYCVNRYTGDYIRGTLSEPGATPKCPVKSKCEQEREKLHGKNYRNFGKPGYTPRIILSCNKDGFYDLLQTDTRSKVNWCVDELTGEYISPSVMHFPRVPDCSKVSPPHTRCEREKAETGRKHMVAPDTFVPHCNNYNGLYLDVQVQPSGWKWCVEAFEGTPVNGTETPPGVPPPTCPERTDCQEEKYQAHTYNYRNFSQAHYEEVFVPMCEANGLYSAVQNNDTHAWCVDMLTGDTIESTIKNVKEGIPDCPGEAAYAKQKTTLVIPPPPPPSNKTVTTPGNTPPKPPPSTLTAAQPPKPPPSTLSAQPPALVAPLPAAPPVPPANQSALPPPALVAPLSNASVTAPKPEAATPTNESLPKPEPAAVAPVNGSVEALSGAAIEKALKANNDTVLSSPSEAAAAETAPVVNEPVASPAAAAPAAGAGNVSVPWLSGDAIGKAMAGNDTTLSPSEQATAEAAPAAPAPAAAAAAPAAAPAAPVPAPVPAAVPVAAEAAVNETVASPNVAAASPPSSSTMAAAVPVPSAPSASEAAVVVPPPPPPQSPIETFTDATNASLAIGQAVHFTPEANKTWLLLPPGATGAPSVPQVAPLVNVNTGLSQVSTGASVVPAVAVKDILKDNLLAPAPVAQLFNNQSEATLLPNKDLPVNLDLYNTTQADEVGPDGEYNVHEEGLYTPSFPCDVERDFANQNRIKFNIIGAFLPACDGKGLYMALQTNTTSGDKWCVDPTTGHEIVRTRVAKGETIDCDNVDTKKGRNGSRIDKMPIGVPAIMHVPDPNSNVTGKYILVVNTGENSTDGLTAGAPAPQRETIAQPEAVQRSTTEAVNNTTAATVQKSDTTENTTTKSTESSNISLPPPAEPLAAVPPPAEPAAAVAPAAEPAAAAPSPAAESAAAVAPAAEPAAPVVPVPSEVQTAVANDTALSRNKVEEKKNSTSSDEGTPLSSYENITTVKANLTDAKEGMKDLGEAIGNLFGGLFSAMIPITNETTNVTTAALLPKSGLAKNVSQSAPTNYTIEFDASDSYAKEKAELIEYAHNCPYELGTNLTKMGCMNDDQQVPRPLPVMLLNLTHVNTGFTTEEWKIFVHGLLCRCAIETRKKGWYTFGLQAYGECFSGPDEGRWNEDGEAPSEMCIDVKQETCDKESNKACAGIEEYDKQSGKMKSANFVYMTVTDTHKEIVKIIYDKKRRKRHTSHLSSHLRRKGHKNHHHGLKKRST